MYVTSLKQHRATKLYMQCYVNRKKSLKPKRLYTQCLQSSADLMNSFDIGNISHTSYTKIM